MTGTAQAWHHAVYDDCDKWSDAKLKAVYKRLSRDLRLGDRNGTDMAHVTRMIQVETELAERGIDPRPIAQEIEEELGR